MIWIMDCLRVTFLIELSIIWKDFWEDKNKVKLRLLVNWWDDYLYIQDFYLNLYYETEFYDNTSYKEFLYLIGKLYNKIKIEFVFSDYYEGGYCI